MHVVIVTHQSEGHIEACLRSVRSSAATLLITVVDNASTDGTVERVRNRQPSVTVWHNGSNLGFARAVNLVSDRVQSDYLLLLNPDVRLMPDAIDSLIGAAMALPAAGLYGGRCYAPDGSLDPSSCQALPSVRHALAFASGSSSKRWPRLDPDWLGGWPRDGQREVPVLTGALLLIDRAVWDRLGGFDEHFFLYGEDVDFSIRSRSARATPYFTAECNYWHVRGASSTPATQLVALLAGRLTLARKHLLLLSVVVVRSLTSIGVLLRAMFLVGPRRRCWVQVWEERRLWSRGWPHPDTGLYATKRCDPTRVGALQT